MVDLMEYEDSGIEDFHSPQQQKNAAQFKKFSEMRFDHKENEIQLKVFPEKGSHDKENVTCVSTIIWQSHFSPNTYEAQRMMKAY